MISRPMRRTTGRNNSVIYTIGYAINQEADNALVSGWFLRKSFFLIFSVSLHALFLRPVFALIQVFNMLSFKQKINTRYFSRDATPGPVCFASRSVTQQQQLIYTVSKKVAPPQKKQKFPLFSLRLSMFPNILKICRQFLSTRIYQFWSIYHNI